MVASKPEAVFEFIVSVKLYGFGDETEAAKVFSAYNGRFTLGSGDEAEIIEVAPLPDDAEVSVPAGDAEASKALMKKAADG